MARPADPNARSALVRAARAEFVRSGIQKARIEDIALAAGLSKGAFYLHFESKEALFEELVTEFSSKFDALDNARYHGYRALLASTQDLASPDYLVKMSELDAAQDRLMLEMMWDWRDVLTVLLEGCQGTRFEGVMWELLDKEVERVRSECAALQDAGAAHPDVDPEVLGLTVVGAYLLVARKLAKAREKPDFEALVAKLHRLLGPGLQYPGPGPAPGNGPGGSFVSGQRVKNPTRSRSGRNET